jgi:hypothetical protein
MATSGRAPGARTTCRRGRLRDHLEIASSPSSDDRAPDEGLTSATSSRITQGTDTRSRKPPSGSPLPDLAADRGDRSRARQAAARTRGRRRVDLGAVVDTTVVFEISTATDVGSVSTRISALARAWRRMSSRLPGRPSRDRVGGRRKAFRRGLDPPSIPAARERRAGTGQLGREARPPIAADRPRTGSATPGRPAGRPPSPIARGPDRPPRASPPARSSGRSPTTIGRACRGDLWRSAFAPLPEPTGRATGAPRRAPGSSAGPRLRCTR